MPAWPLPPTKWDTFIQRLGGPEGCNFRRVGEDLQWSCRSQARAILERMGYSGRIADRVMRFCAQHGGRCDCEIFFNVTTAILRSEHAPTKRALN